MQLTNPFILDGATGSNLIKAGMPSGICVEEWILEHPEILTDLQRRYVQAGSQAVLAPTFGANRKKLSELGYGDKVEFFNEALVALSKKAVEGKAQVFGDMSPSGEFVFPIGEATMESLVALYEEQAHVLAKAGVDGVVIETQMNLADARAAAIACKKHQLPFMVSITVDQKGRTLSGCDLPSAVVTLQAMGAQAVGLNCSMGPAGMVNAVTEGFRVAKVPIIAKPNAGLPLEGQTGAYDMTSDQFADQMMLLIDAGASVVGGCCGTTPEHIAQLKKKIRRGCPERNSPREYLAREGKVFPFFSRMALSNVIRADENLADNAMEAMENGAALLLVEIVDEESVENLILYSSSLMLPVCLTGGDAGLLEKALLSYQGRAAVLAEGIGKAELDGYTKVYGALHIS